MIKVIIPMIMDEERIFVFKKEKDMPITNASILVAIERINISWNLRESLIPLLSSFFNIKKPIVTKSIVEI